MQEQQLITADMPIGEVVALGTPNTQPPAVPLLQDRGLVDGQAAAYVCRSFTCRAPATEPEALRVQLEQR